MELTRVEYGEGWKSFCEIAMACFKDWDPVAETLSADSTENFILSADTEKIGIATVHTDVPETVLLRNIGIKPEFQRAGYGRILLAELETALSGRFNRLELMTEPQNIPYYEDSGFQLENSLPNASDWRYMTKDI